MKLLTSRILQAHGAPHAFPTRAGGVSASPFDSLNLGRAVGDDPAAVDENHRRLAAALGLGALPLVTVKQVHGDRVVHAAPGKGGPELRETRAGEPLAGEVEADALVAAAGVALGVRVADCVPILLHDPITGASAAVHAGWRGTVAQIVAKTVAILADEYGARPASIRAALGPAIGPCCFEVGADLAARFASDPAFGPATVRGGEGQPRVDLFAANRRLLEAAGVSAHHIEQVGECTSCRPDLFFSHRRDAGRTGRHLAVIAAGRF